MMQSGSQLVGVVGQGVLDPGTLTVSADDLGLTRGDGAFDATRVRTDDRGRSAIDHVDAHLERLVRSVTALDAPPPALGPWRELIEQLTQAWTTPGEAVLKLMWTRGPESANGVPTQVATITALTESTFRARHGLDVVTLCRGYASDAFLQRPWLLGGVKSLSYAVNAASQREARRRGAGDVLFTSSDGFCLEGPTSALVALIDDQLVTTPHQGTGILASITQAVIFEHADREGVPVTEALLTPAQVTAAQSAWLVSSVRGVAPIVSLDGAPITVDAGWTARAKAWAGFAEPPA